MASIDGKEAAEVDALIVSQYWPDPHGGGSICVRSTLDVFSPLFRHIHFVCVSNLPFATENEGRWPNVRFVSVRTRDEAKWLRFLKSLQSPQPAIAVKYWAVRERFFEEIDAWLAGRKPESPVVAIVTDMAAGCYLPRLKSRYPWLATALQSQNVLVKSFDKFQREGNLMQRLAWAWEMRRIYRFERQSIALADRLWPLTQKEADEYRQWLDAESDGVVGVAFDIARYENVHSGNSKTVLFLGNVDMRKGIGLRRFVQHAWPKVRASVPDARLLLGGRNTEKYADLEIGIESVGPVLHDVDFLHHGSLFINPQQHGAGLQVKSIVAMLSGKVLISTPTGVEGVEGADGDHFIMVQDPRDMASAIIEFMRNPQRGAEIGERARALMMNERSVATISQQARPLADRLTMLAIERAPTHLSEMSEPEDVQSNRRRNQ